MSQPSAETRPMNIRIVGYNDPAIEGSNITFGCSSELMFIYLNLYGEWRMGA